MAHGPDTVEIQDLFESMEDGYLDIDLSAYVISSLPEFPQGLVNLFISNGVLPGIPNFPPGVQVIRIRDVEIENGIIPPLPEGLAQFGCMETYVKTLPALPSTLTRLTCYANPNLTSLPVLPPSLIDIDCSECNLHSLPDLPPTLITLYCSGNPITTLPALPAGLKALIALHCNQLETLTPPCPAALRLIRVTEIFGNLNLEPRPEPTELLGAYMGRIAGVPPAPRPTWAGYSRADVELFKGFFNPETRNNISVCPVCIGYADRYDGCMYMSHVCDPDARHPELYDTYEDKGEIEWCTICGRITHNHKHYTVNLPNERRPVMVQNQIKNVIEHYQNDCRSVGGGGYEEKFRRLEKLLNYACQLQEEVGRGDAKEVRKELIEEVWKSALLKDRTVLKKFEKGKFDFPCEFPDDSAPAQAEREYPDIPVPDGVVPPVKHETPDNECITELGEHDDHRPVYQFIHENWKHEGEYICGPDLEAGLKTNLFTGLCPINPAECKSRLYPIELKNLVSPEYQEIYRKLFNKQFAAREGEVLHIAGGRTSIMYKIDPKTIKCPVMPKGGRKTYRRKRRITRKRGPLRSSFKKVVQVRSKNGRGPPYKSTARRHRKS
jgi:hypothetical protein